MQAQELDYYEILGVPRDADDNAIKKAYHKLAMHWHPDRNKSPEAEEKFKQIAKAYAILKDPKKRARYNAQGAEGVAHYTPEDLFGDFDLGDVFGGMNFGFGGGNIFDSIFGRRTTRHLHGQDLRLSIGVPLHTVYAGGKQTIHVSHPVTCSKCHGFGTKSGKAPPKCNECQGSGKKVIGHSSNQDEHTVQFQQIIVCPVCHGKGTSIDKPCRECGGYGQIEKEEKLNIQIPKGIAEGAVLRVPGHGMPGETPEIPQGDLYVSVFSQPDKLFQRQGADLWYTVRLDVLDAILGTTIQVPSMDKKFQVNIPAGTQPDEVLRLKEKGLPRYENNGYGDIKIKVQIVVPTQLNEEQKMLYEKLKALH